MGGVNQRARLYLTPSGFECERTSGSHAVEWSDIIEICAFKVDLFAVDEVRFSLSLRDGTTLEVSEEQPGFAAFVDALKERFSTVEGWENRVIQPPFETNMTILYRGT